MAGEQLISFLPNVSQSQNQFRFRQDIKKSLCPPPAHNRDSSEIRCGCSGLYPVGFWKPLQLKTAELVWAACPRAGLFSESGIFSTYPTWTSLVSVHATEYHPPSMCGCGGPHCLPENLSVDTRGTIVRSPQNSLVFRLNKSQSLSFSQQGKCSGLLHPAESAPVF